MWLVELRLIRFPILSFKVELGKFGGRKDMDLKIQFRHNLHSNDVYRSVTMTTSSKYACT